MSHEPPPKLKLRPSDETPTKPVPSNDTLIGLPQKSTQEQPGSTFKLKANDRTPEHVPVRSPDPVPSPTSGLPLQSNVNHRSPVSAPPILFKVDEPAPPRARPPSGEDQLPIVAVPVPLAKKRAASRTFLLSGMLVLVLFVGWFFFLRPQAPPPPPAKKISPLPVANSTAAKKVDPLASKVPPQTIPENAAQSSDDTASLSAQAAELARKRKLAELAANESAYRHFVADMKITGVSHSTPVRVLINRVIYAQGDTLNSILGIKFIGYDATTGILTFSDATGLTLERHYP